MVVVTKKLSSGKGKNASQTYAPDTCDDATTQDGGSVAVITLASGLSVLHVETSLYRSPDVGDTRCRSEPADHAAGVS